MQLATLNKRLDKLENMVVMAGAKSKSSVIGICDLEQNVIDRLYIDGEAANDDPEIFIPSKLSSLLQPARYKVCYGGRGSAKTRTIVSLLVEKARIKFERILCCREIQKSIQDSSYQEIVDEIARRGLDDEFKILEKKIIHRTTGSTFSFEGLYRNQTKIKGYAGATIVWVEEAENISQKSWDYLIATIRAKGSEIWVSFNPANEDDPTWTEHVKPNLDHIVEGVSITTREVILRGKKVEAKTITIEMNYYDNPWFPAELEVDRVKMMERDYDRYLWIWEGKFFDRSEAQVLAGKWKVKEFEKPEEIEPYHGMDFGFSNDPSAVLRCWIMDECLYIDYESGGVGVPLDDHGKLIDKIPGAAEYKIRCDCARPETINHLQRMGYRTEAAPKWAGSVEDGIEHLRSYKMIYIHPRCKEVINEAKNYSYKVDSRTDDVLPKLEDKFNHYIDALRYALAPLIQVKQAPAIMLPF